MSRPNRHSLPSPALHPALVRLVHVLARTAAREAMLAAEDRR